MAYEDESEEWKESLGEKGWRTIAAFANSDGGRLIIGKSDDGAVLGVSNPEKLMEDIPNRSKSMLGFLPRVRRVPGDDGRECIEVVVAPQPFPVLYNGKFYVRSGSTTQELTGPDLTKLLLKRESKTWTDLPAENVMANDLSAEAIRLFVSQGKEKGRMSRYASADDVKALLDNYDLIDSGGLRIAGALLFHPRPNRVVLGAYIEIGVFDGDGRLLRSDIVDGPVLMQAEDAIDILYGKHIRGTYKLNGIVRETDYEYPRSALRESLMNAVVHKDYSRFNTTTVSVFPDRIEVFNCGGLPDGWTIADLKSKHRSSPRNQRMARVFFDMGLIEKWGTGIRNMATACREAGLADPEFSVDRDGVTVTFHPVASGRNVADRLSANEQRLLEAIRASEGSTTKDLISSAGLSEGQTKYALAALAEKRLIEKEGTRRGVWKARSN
ncbi:MAG: putative DNA binding domain-containing protein [Candidatus Methanoplasma sp.]|nr:putative DNA binding domain-containing protein [Candidatus Methanoplasma sp.]